MNDVWFPGQITWVDAQGRPLPWYCQKHFRRLDATGLCLHCQRDAVEQALERARAEEDRQTALAEECADRADMWDIG